MLDKKSFLNSYQDNWDFIINYNNKKRIHHNDCFGYIFCHQKKTIKFCWFRMFFFYGVYVKSMHWMSYIFIIQQNVSIFIMAYCCNNIFIHEFCFFYSLLSSTKNEYIFSFSSTNYLIAKPAVSSCHFSND